LLITKYYSCDQSKADEPNGTSEMRGAKEYMCVLRGKPKETDNLEILYVDGGRY